MTFNKIKILIGILILPVFTWGQVTNIKGSAPGAERRTIHLMVPGDLITFWEKDLAESSIDSIGQFSLQLALKTPVYASLNIDFHRVDIFLEPGKTYTIKCNPMNYKLITEVNPLMQSQNIEVEFVNSDSEDLNVLITKFNVLYNNFILQNFNDLYRDRNKAKLDTFRRQVVTSFPERKNGYFASYIHYKIAGLEQLAQAFSKPQLAKKYFMESPILYENVEYMDFFNQYFAKHLTATSRVLKFTDYTSILNTAGSYQNMMKVLDKDTILRKPQFRELVMLKGLMEMFSMSGYNQESVLSLMRTISTDSKFMENREVALDMILFLTRLRAGTPAPGFKLQARDGKMISSTDFKGKPLLLNFWTTYCQRCLTEMDMMKPLYEKYKDKMNFVSISADNQFQKMLYFINMKTDFTWQFLYIGDQWQLLKDYDVRSYPLFVLIDEKGNICKYPAELPDAGLGESIDKLLSP
ncbi:MAG: TlpA disulfide reductase family protein [Bacteroidetes bacterium]|nr:TlpA disulfide reductase family protein [Bacteroidota bacterium]